MSGILAVLTKAAAFILIIVMGYVLKRKGFFHPDDFYLISKIVIRITLQLFLTSAILPWIVPCCFCVCWELFAILLW